VTNALFMVEHSQNIIKSSSQTLHALRILRSHSMSATIIQHVFQAVVISCQTYLCLAILVRLYRGCRYTASKCFLRRSIRRSFCPPDLTYITDIFDAADEALFCKILHDPNHLLAPCSPMKPTHHTTSGQGAMQLIPKINKLYDIDFIHRMLYKDRGLVLIDDSLLDLCIVLYFTLLLSCWAAFCQLIINEYCIASYGIVG